MDKADGSGTLLFDLAQRDWSGEMLAALEIAARVAAADLRGARGRRARSARRRRALTGLPAGTPVVAGGGDQAARRSASARSSRASLALTLGTSGVVFATTRPAVIEPEGRLHAFCHAVPGRWHLMGVMLSAAGSLQWLPRHARAGRRASMTLVSEAADGAGRAARGCCSCPT